MEEKNNTQHILDNRDNLNINSKVTRVRCFKKTREKCQFRMH